MQEAMISTTERLQAAEQELSELRTKLQAQTEKVVTNIECFLMLLWKMVF